MNNDDKNTTLSVEARAQALLSQMTLREKIGQLNQKLYGFSSYEVVDNQVVLTDSFKEEVRKWGGLGVLYGLHRADPWSEKDFETGLYREKAVEAYNLAQEYVLSHSRLGIPALFSTECPHGHQALDGYLLPVNLAMGATFNPQLVGEAYRICGKQMKELGIDLALISLLDILRDPRWGRSEECFGEDPYLASEMAAAVAKAVQQEGVDVVAKHFAAQGETTGGINASAARIGSRELWEIHLPAMAACAREGVQGVMAAYNEIDGIPCHGNPWLLKEVLRETMGFDGIVMSDGIAVDRLDLLTGDTVQSGAMALASGVDVSLWDTGFTMLEKAVELGYVSEGKVDEAVGRVLRLKLKRGLFEHPCLSDRENRVFNFDTQKENLKLAEESVVLLKNDGLLPLPAAKPLSITVVGPNASDLYSQLGDYTPPVKSGSGITVAEGIMQFASQNGSGKQQVTVRTGCGGVHHEQLLREAVKQAEESDITVLVLGGSSSRFGEVNFDNNGAAIMQGRNRMDCGEGVDLSGLELPEEQQLLAEAIYATGSKVITIVIAGRPYAIGNLSKKTAALMYAFYPGPKGGKAIAELIFGKTEPSGRLPVSLPRSAGQLPVYYNHRVSYEAMHYCDEEEGALYKFGDGLGYGKAVYSDFCLSSDEIRCEGDREELVKIAFCIENTGDKPVWAVPMTFISHKQGSVIPRKEELKAFGKWMLQPGEKKAVELTLKGDSFKIWNNRLEYVMEEGNVKLQVKDMGKILWERNIRTVS